MLLRQMNNAQLLNITHEVKKLAARDRAAAERLLTEYPSLLYALLHVQLLTNTITVAEVNVPPFLVPQT